MSKFDMSVQVEECMPCCPFCGEVLDGVVVNDMHAACNLQFAIEVNILDLAIEPIHQES